MLEVFSNDFFYLFLNYIIHLNFNQILVILSSKKLKKNMYNEMKRDYKLKLNSYEIHPYK